MDFTDRTLVQLADAAGRNAILDQTALAQMVSAAFDVSIMPILGPYALDVDKSELAVEILPRVTVEGSWQRPGETPTSAIFHMAGLRSAPLRVDVLWRGRLIARVAPQDSLIEDATTSFAALDIDRAIAADLGALPADPAALEAERRRRLLVKLRAGMAQPGAMNDAALNRMLAAAEMTSVGELLAARGNAALGTQRVRFSAPATAPPAKPVALPVTIAVLVRDETLKIATLIAESRAAQAALAADPAAQPAPATLRRRTQVLALWIVAEKAFDDVAWPGADRAARRAAAGEMLAAQGIGLAVHAA